VSAGIDDPQGAGAHGMNVVFDLGAVLFTWQPVQLVAQVFPEHAGDAVAAQDLAQAVFGHPDWHAFDRGTVHADEVSAATARRLNLPPQRVAQLVHGIDAYLQPMDESVALLQGLMRERDSRRAAGAPVSGVPRVRGLYYLSNMPAPVARLLQSRHRFLHDFDGGIFSGDVQHIKPEPSIYGLLTQRYALDPQTTVFIDDLLVNVQAAQAQGWTGIHFQSAAQVARELDRILVSPAGAACGF